MWPFSKPREITVAPCATETETETETEVDKAIAALKGWRDIGDEFTYLGRTMIVTAHSSFLVAGWMIGIIPCIKARYVDANGVMRDAMFNVLECKALIEKQPNP